jgi:exodeoxyribonuclease V beta subunit
MQEYDVLDPKSPISGKLFIEASAGTGKTFAIEHMVLRLLLNKTPITEILVVTFTKAGANDLKQRIHHSLLAIKDQIEGEKITFNYLSQIEDKKEAMLLIENACALYTQMPVYTIHGFAFQMLSCFAFEAAIPFDLLHFEDQKQKDIVLTAILDTLRVQNSEDTISVSQCIKMMDKNRRSLSSFTKNVTKIMENEKNIQTPPKWGEIKAAFFSHYEEIEYQTLEEEFLSIASLFKQTTNQANQIHPHLFEQLKALVRKDLDFLILASPCIIELLQESNLKKGKKLSKDFKIIALFKTLLPIFLIAKDPNHPISHIAAQAKSRLEKMSIKSPDSILISMKESLNKPAFKSNIQKLYSVCIIDEFQDTDPIQWEILSSLFFDCSKFFCTVGDPKQSIYAFRGADLPTYLKAKELFPSCYFLSTNFRSNHQIIEGLNKLFCEKTTPGFLSFEENSLNLRYNQVKSGKNKEEKGAIEFLFAPAQKKKSMLGSIAEIENLYFFPFIVNKIKQLDTDLNNIAILVKDRYQGLSLSIYLQGKKIPVKANISASLLDSSLFSLFETLLFLTYNPRSESLIKKLLTFSIFNVPSDLLKEDLSNPILQKLSIDFTILKNILEKDLPSYLFALMETKIFGPYSLGEILCKKEDLYLTMIQIFSLFLSNFDKDPKNYISEIQKLNPDLFTFLKKNTGTDKKSVTIMTSHLSKGLEFDTVFALSLYSRMDLSFKTEGECILADKEKMRLLYVTLTRAKNNLFVFGTFFGEIFPLQKGCASPIELFFSRVNRPFLDYSKLYKAAGELTYETIVENSFVPTKILSPSCCTGFKEEEALTSLFPPEPLPSYKQMHLSYSFSSLPFEKKGHIPIEKPASFPYGSKVGSQIHLFLEKIIEEGLYRPFNKQKILPILEKSFAHTPLENYEEIVFEKLEEAFKSPLISLFGSFTLESIPPEHMWGETLFSYNMEGIDARMKGFCDLIVFYQDRFYIIDWKCNHLENFSKEKLEKTLEDNNYNKQAAIYSRALKAFLTQKNLSFEKNAGGAFYIFIRGGREGIIYLPKNVMEDKEIICLI